MRLLSLFLAALLFALPLRALTEDKPVLPVLKIDNTIVDLTVSGWLNQLAVIKKTNPDRVIIHINSPGGAVFAGMELIEGIIDSGIPTTCVVDDYAASMAAILFESNACGVRLVHPYSMIMIHGVSVTPGEGPQRGIQNTIERINALNKWMMEIFVARTGWERDWFWQRFIEEGRELWVIGIEAIAYHLADGTVIDQPAIVAPKPDPAPEAKPETKEPADPEPEPLGI